MKSPQRTRRGRASGERPPELGDLLVALCDATRVAFGAESVSIAVVDERAGHLEYVAAAGRGASEVSGMLLPLGQGLAGYAVAAAETLSVDDVSRDPRFARDVAERIGYVPRAVLVAPIRRGDEVLGVLSILDKTEPPGAAALDRAGRFANAAAGALAFIAVSAQRDASSGSNDDAAIVDALARARDLGPVERDAAGRLLDEFLAFAAARRRQG